MDENELQGPTYQFTAYPDQQVMSMVSTDTFLVTGTSGEVHGWNWKMIASGKATKIKASWIVLLPVNKYVYSQYKIKKPIILKWNTESVHVLKFHIKIFRDSYEKPDVNYLVYSKQSNLLYAGCGDNNIYVISLEDGRIVRSLEGHTDYIHSLSLTYVSSNNRVVLQQIILFA